LPGTKERGAKEHIYMLPIGFKETTKKRLGLHHHLILIGFTILSLSLAGLVKNSAIGVCYLNLGMIEIEKVLSAPSSRADEHLAKAENLAQMASNWGFAKERVLWVMGWVFRARGEFAKAEQFLAKSLNASPRDPLIHFHQGQLLYLAGKEADAISHWSLAKAAPFFLHCAMAARARGDLMEAERLARIATRLDKNSGEALFLLAEVLLQKPQPELGEVREILEHAASLESESRLGASVLARLGDVRHFLGDEKGAVSAYEQALKRDPKSAHALTGLGRSIYLIENNRAEEALQILAKAMALDLSYVWPLLYTAQIYENRGEYAKALKWYLISLVAFPRDPVPHIYIARYYARLGLMQLAIQKYWEALDRGAGEHVRRELERLLLKER